MVHNKKHMKKIIHINQHVIRANKKNGTKHPVITVKTYKSNTYCQRVKIHGPCEVVYSPDKPLSCGARVWIECECDLTMIGSVVGRPDDACPLK